MRKTLLIIASICLLAALVLVVIQLYRHSRTFDSLRWKAAPAVQSHYRLRAVDDLLARYKLVGMSRSEAIDLLGQPNYTSYGNDPALRYWMGPQRTGFPIDDEWLLLLLNQDDMVHAVRIVYD